ncbi:MAG: hypothetical protein ACRCVT_13240 [Leadbetterella sp.]
MKTRQVKQTKLVLAGLILLLACKTKNVSSDTTGGSDAYRIKKIEYVAGSTDTYTYNAESKITQINKGAGAFLKFSYDTQGKMTSEEHRGNPDGEENFLTTYSYSSSGYLTEQITTYEDGSKERLVYTNNSSGLPTNIKHYKGSKSSTAWVESPNDHEDYVYNSSNQCTRNNRSFDYDLNAYDSKGNLTETKQYYKKSNGSYYLNNQTNISYDDKKAIQDLPEIKLINNPLETKIKHWEEDGSADDPITLKSSYEYNSDGYVTKRFEGGALYATYTLEKAK